MQQRDKIKHKNCGWDNANQNVKIQPNKSSSNYTLIFILFLR